VKNPKKLEIHIKIPGQPKIVELDADMHERVKSASIFKINTFFGLLMTNVNLIDFPFRMILDLRSNEKTCQ